MQLGENYGIRKAMNKKACEKARGVWRRGVKGVRKGSCALPSSRSKMRKKANLAKCGRR